MGGTTAAKSVVVVGPADLVTTAVVDALRVQGIDVTRADELFRLADPIPVGIAIVDVSGQDNAMRLVSAALDGGWQVVVLSEDGREPRVAAAVAHGAAAWLSTKAPVRQLSEVVHRLCAGCCVMTDEDRAAWERMNKRNLAEADQLVAVLDLLTDREFGVLRAMERGLRAADIADQNVVALTTVRTQIRSILQKLGVNSQESAIDLYRAALKARGDRG
jgi:two-component system nitrate/nitrite response regulator NarL